MGRSVNYLDNASEVIYFIAEGIDDEWEGKDFQDNLINEICCKCKSYAESEKWDNNETKIILENSLCVIDISEYCGTYSLSIAPSYNDYDTYIENFAKHHASQIRKTLEKCLIDCGAVVLNRVGTFSNGEGVYEYKK